MTQYKERDKSKKRAAIIYGAEDIFISMGYKEASMDKIAEKAGISKKTVYNHFQSKENLFEVIVNGLTERQQHLKTITYDSNKSLKEQLLVFAESEISLIDSPKKLELSRFLTLTFLNNLDLQRKIVSKYPPMYNTLIEWLKAASDDNRIKTDNFFMSARLFYALVIGTITWPVLFTDGIDMKSTKPVLEEIIELFLARYGVF
jgi:TetR/AcrR family transcriptional regulator of autoinduction and epiphytic fitness